MEVRNPVFDEVLGMQIKELKGCPVCVKRISMDNGKRFLCRNGMKYPRCRRSSNGFKLDCEA